LMIRRIRDLLYDQGFTISGARNQLQEIAPLSLNVREDVVEPDGAKGFVVELPDMEAVRRELFEIRGLLLSAV